MVNGCSRVTSVMRSVLGCNGSCTLRGRGVHMSLVFCLLFCLSRLLIQYVIFTAPIYCKSHWISGYVYDAFKRSYVRVLRSGFSSHHMPMMLLFLPLQRYEILEGGPPCKSMPLVRLGLTSFYTLSVTSSVALYKITLLFGFGGSR